MVNGLSVSIDMSSSSVSTMGEVCRVLLLPLSLLGEAVTLRDFVGVPGALSALFSLPLTGEGGVSFFARLLLGAPVGTNSDECRLTGTLNEREVEELASKPIMTGSSSTRGARLAVGAAALCTPVVPGVACFGFAVTPVTFGLGTAGLNLNVLAAGFVGEPSVPLDVCLARTA